MAPKEECDGCEGLDGVYVSPAKINQFFATLEAHPEMLDDIVNAQESATASSQLTSTTQAFVNTHISGAVSQMVLPSRPPVNPTLQSPVGHLSDPRARILEFIRMSAQKIITRQSNQHAKKDCTITLQRLVAERWFFNTENPEKQGPERDHKVVEITYSWPGKNKEAARRCTQLVEVLNHIQVCVLTLTYVTLRQIFYRSPELFGKQEVVNRLVHDVAFTCRVTREDLHVNAGVKGLIAGRSIEVDGKLVQGGIELVPHGKCHEAFRVCDVNWMLIIEKEATFKTLYEHGLHLEGRNPLGRGLLVTGKGYPDVATRDFVASVARTWRDCEHCQNKPIFGLVDCDPDGLNIFKTYVKGSGLPHELRWVVPSIQFIGIRLDEILPGIEVDDVLKSLTKRDRKLARNMLAKVVEGRYEFPPVDRFSSKELRIFVEADGILHKDAIEQQTRSELEAHYHKFTAGSRSFAPIMKGELQLMLQTNMKAEIEFWHDKPDTLSKYLSAKMYFWRRYGRLSMDLKSFLGIYEGIRLIRERQLSETFRSYQGQSGGSSQGDITDLERVLIAIDGKR